MKTRSLLLFLSLLTFQLPVHAEELRARLEWAHSVDLRAFESGIVEEVNVLEGQAVKKGDVLIRLDPRDCELMVQTANARLKQAEATLEPDMAATPADENMAAMAMPAGSLSSHFLAASNTCPTSPLWETAWAIKRKALGH